MWLPLIPKHLRKGILRNFHDSTAAGHLGVAGTYDRVSKRFYWPCLFLSIRWYVMHCRECQRRKSVSLQPTGHLVPIPPSLAPIHRIG
ncbi:hypothetical protein AVEN_209172-1 [Araneus ventricosus]|uniref:Integrase zinc-binding domain-containing protein n=1 Tax=Araneus ventricosus TaxID=182803 RepID=A0A4Y2JU64_ARAVE|nr:hypothetical protein AVEN_66799-1 [Araneus ventricosus]GBM92746.1 hypothetical protein AVEN_209172-1 [Araneus ventricosus]